MARLLDTRFVLAVRNLAVSHRYYTEVLGFREDPIDAPGWSFLTRDAVRLMIGECPQAMPAGDLGDHSWFAQIEIDSVDAYHAEIVARGGAILSPPENKPWGMREFSVRTPDGHRIGFSQALGE